MLECHSMAVELLKHVEDALSKMPPNNPGRILLERVAKETREHLRIMRLAERLQKAFGSLPDETIISSFIPPSFRTDVGSSIVRRGPYAGMTRQEVYDQHYPLWGEIYLDSEQLEKQLLTNVAAHIMAVGRQGINTFGDLRNASDEALTSFNNTASTSKNFLLLKAGFTPQEPNVPNPAS